MKIGSNFIVWLAIWIACLAVPATAQTVTVRNGAKFIGTNGDPVDAHGAGVIKVGSYYYMVGENRDSNWKFKALSMYRSSNLRDWEWRNDILKSTSHSSLVGINLERPKVIYNAATNKYVMWAHKENGQNYNDARVLVATSSTVDGNYALVGEFRPTINGTDHESRDMNLFLDTDGQGYMISAARVNQDLNIYRLNSSFTNVSALVKVIAGHHREAPALFRRNNVYFLITSGATDWNPNQQKYQTATSLSGNWTNPTDFGDDRGYNTQTNFVLPVTGTNGTTSYLYMGDQWGPAFGLTAMESGYVWLPLSFPTNTSVSMNGSSSISINVSTGTVSNINSTTRIRSNSSSLCAHVYDYGRWYDAGIAQFACGTGANERVERRDLGGGYWSYVYQHSGLCMAKAADSDWVRQTSCTVGQRAQWSVSGTRIINRTNGKCLNIDGASTSVGAWLTTWTCGNEPHSQWSFI